MRKLIIFLLFICISCASEKAAIFTDRFNHEIEIDEIYVTDILKDKEIALEVAKSIWRHSRKIKFPPDQKFEITLINNDRVWYIKAIQYPESGSCKPRINHIKLNKNTCEVLDIWREL